MPKAQKSKPTEPTSELVSKGHPCPDTETCRSSDAAALYDDGHLYCFSCGKRFKGDGESAAPAHVREEEIPEAFPTGSIKGISSRGLTQATCRVWDYQVRQNHAGEIEHLAFYRDPHGHVVGCKARNVGLDGTGKEFYWVGASKDNLYGRHKWSAGGKKLTIVEGEVDCLTVSQCYAHKYPVVSVPNGAHEAAKAVAKNLEFINSFDEVIFGFDMDQQGRDACVACAKLLPPGKAKIAKWTGKDPNEMLQAGKAEEITRCIWNAEPYRPDGVLDARTLTAQCLDPVVTGIPWPWPFMTAWTYGRRDCEVYTIGAGTGIGKSDGIAEIVACTIKGEDKAFAKFEPEGVAIFGYESGPASTKKAIAGKLWGRRFHIPQNASGVSWTDAELRAAMEFMDTDCWNRGGTLFINDSYGAADWDSVVERARYLVHAEGIKHLIVDPISALVAGLEDERKALDKLVLEASSLANELRIKVYLLSHLTRPAQGPSHEEGGHVSLNQFRGSNGIGMFSHFVFGLERNQQAEDETARCVTTLRVVKDRYTGDSTGKTSQVVYDVLTGTLDLPKPAFLGDDQ